MRKIRSAALTSIAAVIDCRAVGLAAIVLLFPAVEMMLGRGWPTFPASLSKRAFDFKRFESFAIRIRPALVAIESLTRPRWNARRN